MGDYYYIYLFLFIYLYVVSFLTLTLVSFLVVPFLTLSFLILSFVILQSRNGRTERECYFFRTEPNGWTGADQDRAKQKRRIKPPFISCTGATFIFYVWKCPQIMNGSVVSSFGSSSERMNPGRSWQTILWNHNNL